VLLLEKKNHTIITDIVRVTYMKNQPPNFEPTPGAYVHTDA